MVCSSETCGFIIRPAKEGDIHKLHNKSENISKSVDKGKQLDEVQNVKPEDGKQVDKEKNIKPDDGKQVDKEKNLKPVDGKQADEENNLNVETTEEEKNYLLM